MCLSKSKLNILYWSLPYLYLCSLKNKASLNRSMYMFEHVDTSLNLGSTSELLLLKNSKGLEYFPYMRLTQAQSPILLYKVLRAPSGVILESRVTPQTKN